MVPPPALSNLAVLILRLVFLTPVITSNSSPTKWKKWCGKNYEPGAPVEPPGGKFQSSTSWTIRCTPVLQPSIDQEPIFLIVDLAAGGQTQLEVADTETGRILFSGPAKSKLKIGPLKVGSARLRPYQIRCRAPIGSHAFQLSHLPRGPTRIVQRDAESGFFRVTDDKGVSRPFFPFGFYTLFHTYMDTPQLSRIIADMKDRRVNTVHLVFGGSTKAEVTAMTKVFKSLDEAGIMFQYDMRDSYQNLTSVTEQVSMIAHQRNLLSYYTADEPDSGDPLNAPELAHRHLSGLDPYHPVALVLNCADFHFTEYSAGTEIIMTDPYPVAMKSPTFSNKWHTPCNTSYGDCGCDNCEGNFLDITRQMSSFRYRRQVLGRSRSMQIWGVPQAFTEDNYWTRQPTYAEFLLGCSLYVMEGAVGLMGWIENHDISSEIRRATKTFGVALERMTNYLTLPNLYLEQSGSSDSQRTVRSRLWTDPKTGISLLIIANPIAFPQPWSIVTKSRKFSKLPKIEGIFDSNVVKSPQVEQTGKIYGQLGVLGCSAMMIHP